MNGRTCQLCGKPLSRFTVGSGGDFCSREHRNQFRLRLGMDRLLEANKVASLMRRRENAKTIPASQLARDLKVLPRLAQPLRVSGGSGALRLPPPPDAQLETPRIAAFPAVPMVLRRAAALIRSAEHAPEPANSFTGRKLRPVLRPRSSGFPVRIASAGMVLSGLNRPRAPRHGQKIAEIARNQPRTRIGGNGIQVRPVRTAPAHAPAPQDARRIDNSADRGRELRVSGGIGFRLPQRRMRPVEFNGPRVTPPAQQTGFEDTTAACRPIKNDTRLASIRIAIRELLVPKPPAQECAVEFHFPDVLETAERRARSNGVVPRVCDVEWTPPAVLRLQLRLDRTLPLRGAAPPVPPALEPHAIPAARRLTLVSFQPREKPFEISPSALHGTLVSSMHFGATPVRQVDSRPATLEEHFDAGLQNWLGGTADWKVDVAGVRPGSLALYSPSLESRDYLMEFLTRIETGGVTWVFRAAGFTDYYQATLAMVPGGGYEFRRSAVIGGAAEAPAIQPVPAALTGKTAVTVRTRIAGNEFSVSLDGRVIDTWTDSRLAAGGIGFTNSPEDRARLYWVKVSPAGHFSKEHSKQ